MFRSLTFTAAALAALAALAVPTAAQADPFQDAAFRAYDSSMASLRRFDQRQRALAAHEAYRLYHGDYWYRQGRYHYAIAWYTSAIKVGSSIEPYRRRAAAYRAVGDYGSANRDEQTYFWRNRAAAHRALGIYYRTQAEIARSATARMNQREKLDEKFGESMGRVGLPDIRPID